MSFLGDASRACAVEEISQMRSRSTFQISFRKLTISVLSNFLAIFFEFFSRYREILPSTIYMPNFRSVGPFKQKLQRGGGRICPAPRPHQSAKSLACLGLKQLTTFIDQRRKGEIYGKRNLKRNIGYAILKKEFWCSLKIKFRSLFLKIKKHQQ